MPLYPEGILGTKSIVNGNHRWVAWAVKLFRHQRPAWVTQPYPHAARLVLRLLGPCVKYTGIMKSSASVRNCYYLTWPKVKVRQVPGCILTSTLASSMETVEKEQMEALSDVTWRAGPWESSMSPSFCVKIDSTEKKVNVTLLCILLNRNK